MNRILASVAVLASAVCHGQSGPSVSDVLNRLNQTHQFHGISISPDGQWITWSEKSGTAPKATTYIRRLSDSPDKARTLHGPNDAEIEDITWAADSSRFAFLSKTAKDDQQQIFAVAPADAEPHQLTHLHGYVTDIRWFHDGNTIAFLYAENGGGAGPLAALPAQVGEVGSAIHNQRITTVSADGSNMQAASPANLNVYEFDWMPDGRSFTGIAAPGPADNNWWTAKLYTFDRANGEASLKYKPPISEQIAIPRSSPDGKYIAFIRGIMSDEGAVGGDLIVLDVAAAKEHDLTPGLPASVSSFEWKDNQHLLMTEEVNGEGAVALIDAITGSKHEEWHGTETLRIGGALVLSQNADTWLAVKSDWQHAPELWYKTSGSDWQQITHANADQRPQWGKAENVSWTSGPMHVQGWLLYPADYDSAKHYPLIVSVHGGPSSMRGNGWPSTHFDMSVMAALGYFVLFPNPRGSYGEGEAFTRANVRDFGGGDLKDILAGVDNVVKRVPVDNDRIGVTGWSYGGYMTMWTVTQTHRFRAAVAGAGIADWLSYYGENSIDEWMVPFFGHTVYDDPAAYAKSSPITFIKNVKTPTLVLVGESDAECPAPQSFEFWHALHTLDVPTKLVVYPGEGHGFHKDEDQIDRMQRTANWFNEYLNHGD